MRLHSRGLQVVTVGDSPLKREERMVLVRRPFCNSGAPTKAYGRVSSGFRSMPVEATRESPGDLWEQTVAAAAGFIDLTATGCKYGGKGIVGRSRGGRA